MTLNIQQEKSRIYKKKELSSTYRL
jgi:hypothetical protein